MDFTTVDEVCFTLNMSPEGMDPYQIGQMEAIIGYVTGIINNYCGWNLLAEDYTNKRLNGTGTDTVDTGIYPVNTVTQVRDMAADGTFTDITSSVEGLDSGELATLPGATVTTFTLGVRNIYATFNAGYTVVPRDLAYAAAQLAALNYKRSATSMIGVEESGFNQGVTKHSSIELPELTKLMLDRYRKVSIY